MEATIKKYEAKLEFLNRSVSSMKHLMGSDELEMMQDLKVLLEEVISDLNELKKQK